MTMLILFTIGLTVAAYAFSRWLFLKYPFPFTNPVFVSTTLIIVILTLLHLDFSHYQPGLKIMTFLLGPATVALAVPLYRKREVLISHLGAVFLGVAAGSLATILSVALMARLFALAEPILLSLLPKSVTVPIAIEIVSIFGGDPALTAAFVVSTGLAGAMFGPTVMNWLKITYPMARGLALGTTSHGQGTAIALTEGEVQGATAGIAMALAAVFTAFMAPVIFPWLL